MTISEGLSGFGTTLKWNGVVIAEGVSFSGPSMSAEKVDLTHSQSPDGFREKSPGVRDGGQLSIKGNFISGDAVQIAAIADFCAGTKRTAVLAGPASAAFTWTATCYVASLDFDYPSDNKIGFSATLEISGKPVLDVTSADNLSALTVTTATLVPAFAAAKYSYTANTTGTSVTVTPTCAGATSIGVYADEVLVSSLASGGTSSAIAITTAANVTIKVKVKMTGKVDRIYTLILFKSA